MMNKEELFSLKINKPDTQTALASKKHWDSIAKPIDSLGRFEDIIVRIASIQGRIIPDISKRKLIIMCADNGIVDEGVTQTDRSVTEAVASLMGKGKSSVGIMSETLSLDISVYDIGMSTDDTPDGVENIKIEKGTADFLKSPAMREEDCLKAINAGIEAVKNCKKDGYGIIATGEMGIGNTTTSSAVLCAMEGLKAEEFTGRGSGLDDEGFSRKLKVIEEGLKLHRKDRYLQPVKTKEEMLNVLACLGGFDIAGLTGVYIGGALYGIPVVIDGLISAASALTAEKLVPGCSEYMIASHLGKERGMEVVMERLSLKPVIHADLALGEGTGAVMMLPLLDMTMALYRNGTAFSDTEITQYERFKK